MRRLLPLILCLGLAGPTAAQIDPDMDQIGVYFDPGATTNEILGVAPGVHGPGFVFVIVTNFHASLLYDLGGVVFHLEIEGPCTVLDWGLPATALNISVAPDFVLGFSPPLLGSLTLVVLDPTIQVTGPEPISFTLRGPDFMGPGGLPECNCAGDLCCGYTLGYSTGLDETGAPNVSAVINGEAPVPLGATTWGSVKMLYRQGR